MMADTGWKSPTSCGTPHNEFTNPANAYSSDDTYATTGNLVNYGENYLQVQLTSDGSSYTPDPAKQAVFLEDEESVISLGGVSDTWGKTWDAEEFANSKFRVMIWLRYEIFFDVWIDIREDYGGFGMNIPKKSPINGIEVSVEGYFHDPIIGSRIFYVDHIQAKVSYTSLESPMPIFRK